LNREHVVQHISTIYSTLLKIFKNAYKENKPPSIIADSLAESRLNSI
jgi:hypothetical protein